MKDDTPQQKPRTVTRDSYIEPTFPEAHAAVVARGGQQCAGDVPAHSPHLRVVVVKLGHDLHIELGGSRGRALLPVRWTDDSKRSLSEVGPRFCHKPCFHSDRGIGRSVLNTKKTLNA